MEKNEEQKDIHFLTNNQLVDLMIEKGISVDCKEATEKLISKYSYYSIINTYKPIFKDCNNNYKSGTNFNEIYELYKFDKSLKPLFMKYLLEIESLIDSKISYVFSENYGITEYLDKSNFDFPTDEDERFEKQRINISKLIDEINDDIEDAKSKHNSIIHYMDVYGFVPPWVLTKILSFGTISRFYGLMKQSDKQSVSKDFNLFDNELKNILINLTLIRNICAHDDRLFSYRNNWYIDINKIYKKDIVNKQSPLYTNLFIIILSMKKILDDANFVNFCDELKNEINEISSKLKTISISDVLNVMGFPKEWENLMKSV